MVEILIRALVSRARRTLDKVNELDGEPELKQWLIAEFETWLREKLGAP